MHIRNQKLEFVQAKIKYEKRYQARMNSKEPTHAKYLINYLGLVENKKKKKPRRLSVKCDIKN